MWPKLIMCARTPVRVVIESAEPNSYGERTALLDAEFRCNYQDSSGAKITAKKQEIPASACILISGDIAPGIERIGCGYVVIHGIKRDIVAGAKWRNPDGTVNYCRLDVE